MSTPSIRALAAISWLAVSALPQQSAWTATPVAGTANTVVVVAYARGFDHDPPTCRGLARVLVGARLAAARAAVDAANTGAQVYGDLALAFGEVSPADAGAFAAALLGDARSLPDAELEQVLARAALVADDAAWLYPGQVLETRLRAALLRGPAAAAPAGDAAALHAATVALVRTELGTALAMRGAWFGAPPASGSLPALPELPWPPAVALPAATPGGPLTLPSEVHPRLDWPWVGVAFVVPDGLDRPTLALALEVARLRAARRLPWRGPEAAARAPVVGWAWRDGAPLVTFCRLGWRGDAAAAQAELAGLLADLRDQPPTAAELATAAQALAGETAGAPGGLTSAGGDLVGRALAVELARHRGLAGVEWRNIPAAPVAAALAQVLVDERSAWLHLLPVARREPPRR